MKECETFAICEQCGHPIQKANDFYEGERYVELMPDYYVHTECMSAWIKANEQEAK